MPHEGHTTIEMSRRSPQPHHPPGGHHPAGGHGAHESPMGHRGPLAGAHASPVHGGHAGNGTHHARGHTNGGNGRNGAHLLSPHHAAVGTRATPHTAGRSRTPSPHHSNTNLHPSPNNSHSNSNHSINLIPTDDKLPALSRPRRDLSAGAAIEPLTLVITEGANNNNNNNNRAQPLLERDANNPQPPLAGSEMDDLSDDSDIPKTAEAHPGVDDAFFGSPPSGEGEGVGVGEDAGKGEGEWEGGDTEDEEKKEGDEDGALEPGSDYPLLGDHKPKWDGEGDGEKIWTNGDEVDGIGNGNNDNFLPGITPRFGSETPFPYAPEFAPGAVPPRVTPDVNVYQQKKNLAQGMMDLALLSANANQLRYVLEAGSTYHPYYIPSLIFISASLILQIAVGVGLIVNSTYDVKHHDDICKADKINNFTVIGIFLITVVNVFIASFGVSQLPTSGGTGS